MSPLPLPLQFGVPGGVELLVLLLVTVLLFGVPLVLLAVGVVGYRRLSDDERIEKLERRVAELEREVDGERAGGQRDGEDR